MRSAPRRAVSRGRQDALTRNAHDSQNRSHDSIRGTHIGGPFDSTTADHGRAQATGVNLAQHEPATASRVVHSLDLASHWKAFGDVFKIRDEEIGDYHCDIEVVGELARPAFIINQAIETQAPPGDKRLEPYQPVEFVFDHRRETE
jgi:hypothetical protein